ncbi:MAG: hypothetical protein CGU28_16100 [Candidatus Dactylopiibacterium carminicum]|uniref:DUF1854 domain-containing protein n=1 Tax=Candidatus Dactylopiibacterium carminicum TaxID=857335 RepID=A0A272EWK3_9RHOO|nr:DUF1854 domain-containing protein [Candidatus Dactylopiibacterium carminicum]KAF7599247.1 DUF1854 domain-containing protein [Candidatus Dactylopiibacterium carminicum]PAS92794.1 MAG: hypothetical protein CGU28_16100 [Candidatus Dactylopiibacterium carminicum]PAS94497.1 MAG: hypothetical protein CGU29_04120 [Candidatus Dactylopiibacterium carminicum]PAS99254.1 MAG: hypothetical protein BSR46_09220 [Candidatus Dactylopiibacterium carminicum]
MMGQVDFAFEHNAFGQLVLIDANGGRHDNVLPVRAHPVSAPDEGVSIVDQDGHELLWIPSLNELPDGMRDLLAAALAAREFMPEIMRLVSVSSFATPSTWQVETSRGTTRFVLKGEEDIRRLPGGILLVADAHGIQFMVRDVRALDRHSRRLLDRFL